MKRKFYVIILPVVVLILSFLIYAQRPQEDWRLKRIRVDNFDEKILSIFREPSAETTKTSETPYRPLLIAKDKDIVFFNADGSIKKAFLAWKSSEINVSKDRSVVGFIEPILEDENLRVELSLVDAQANLICKAENVKPEEQHVYFDVLSNDAVVIKHVFTGKLSFYNRTGEQLLLEKELSLFDKPTMDFRTDFSEDGELYAVNGSLGEKATVKVFNSSGQELWERTLDEPSAGEISISGNLANYYVFAVAYDKVSEKRKIYIFRDNTKIYEMEVPYVGNYFCSFSPNNKYCAISGITNKIHMVDLENGKTMWTLNEPDELIGFTSIVILDEDAFLIAGATTLDYNDDKKPRYLYLIDLKKGETLSKLSLDGDEFENRLHGPEVRLIDKKDKFVEVNMPKTSYLYQVVNVND